MMIWSWSQKALRRLGEAKLAPVVFGLIVATGLGLRLCNIGREPFWGDEALSFDVARSFDSFGTMIRYLREVEVHPPLYYVLLRPWLGWFGESEAAARALSLVFSLGIVALAYFLARTLFSDRRVGLLAALITAVLPLQVEFGQEARPYALYGFCAGLAAYGLWRYLRERRGVFLAVYIASSIAGLYLHYSFFFAAAALGSWWLLEIIVDPGRRSRRLVELLAAHAAIFLGFYPWLDTFLYKIELGQFVLFGLPRTVANLPTAAPPDQIERSLSGLIWTARETVVPKLAVIGAMLGKFAVAAAAVTTLRQASLDRSRRPLLFAAWSVFAPLALFMLSPQSIAYATLVQRHVLPAALFLAILLAWIFVTAGGWRGVVFGLVFLISLTTFTASVAGDDAAWDRFFSLKTVGRFISDNHRPGDLVVIPYAFSRTDVNHYLQPEIETASLMPTTYYGRDVWNTRTTLGLVENETHFRMQQPNKADTDEKLRQLIEVRRRPDRVWVFDAMSGNSIEQWLLARGWRHVFRSVGDLLPIDLYERPAE